MRWRNKYSLHIFSVIWPTRGLGRLLSSEGGEWVYEETGRTSGVLGTSQGKLRGLRELRRELGIWYGFGGSCQGFGRYMDTFSFLHYRSPKKVLK